MRGVLRVLAVSLVVVVGLGGDSVSATVGIVLAGIWEAGIVAWWVSRAPGSRAVDVFPVALPACARGRERWNGSWRGAHRRPGW